MSIETQLTVIIWLLFIVLGFLGFIVGMLYAISKRM